MKAYERSLRECRKLFISQQQQAFERQYSAEATLIRFLGDELNCGKRRYSESMVEDVLAIHKATLMHEHGFLRNSPRDALAAIVSGEDISEVLAEMDNKRYKVYEIFQRVQKQQSYKKIIANFYLDTIQDLLR